MTATDGLDQALAQVALNLLIADSALHVYDGKVPVGATPPYVLVYTVIDRPEADYDQALDNLSSTWLCRWICHCVGSGEDASAARAVAQRVRFALLDVIPAVDGLACQRIRLETSSPPIRDETTGELYMDAIVSYRLRATTVNN